MTHEQETAHAHDSQLPRASHDRDPAVPGQRSRAEQLVGPHPPTPSGIIQRKRDGNGVADNADSAVATATTSSGSPLPSGLMRKFESSLGADLSSVRVHADNRSADAARAVGARAYTLGNDIHFAAGHYDPSSSAGEHLLAHEVAHTVQQAGTIGRRTQFKLEVSSPGDAHELEADRAADAMIAGTRFGVSAHANPAAHRDADPAVIDPKSYADDPDHHAYEDVAISGDGGKYVSWNDTYKMSDGTVKADKHVGLNVYGAAATAQGIKVDKLDVYATADVSDVDWGTREAAGTASPAAWDVTLAPTPKQPKPVTGPDPTLALSPGDKTSPIPLQQSQIAFAQSCVNAFYKAHDQAKSSWDAAAPLITAFNKTGEDPKYLEGGLDFLPTKAAAEAAKDKPLDQVASGVPVGLDDKTGTASSTVGAVMKLEDKDLTALKSNFPDKQKAVLQNDAGTVSSTATKVRTQLQRIERLKQDERGANDNLQLVKDEITLLKLETEKDTATEDLERAKEFRETTKAIVEVVSSLVEATFAASEPEHAAEKATFAVLKAVGTVAASYQKESAIKDATARFANALAKIGPLAEKIHAGKVASAMAAIGRAAQATIEAKQDLPPLLKELDNAYGGFAKQAGKQVGGQKGKQLQAALEALPKIAIVEQACDQIANAITTPAFSREAGIGALAATNPPELLFTLRVTQLRGYKKAFADKAKHWGDVRVKLEAVTKT